MRIEEPIITIKAEFESEERNSLIRAKETLEKCLGVMKTKKFTTCLCRDYDEEYFVDIFDIECACKTLGLLLNLEEME